MAGHLAYLGILAAPTLKGRRAVAVALSGAVELYHLVDAGLVSDSKAVADWLWTAGINPDEAASALPPEILLSDVLLPELGRSALVVCHSDMDVELVDTLVTTLGRQGNPAIISGIDLTGPIQEATNGAAGRRAFALQARYEAMLEQAAKAPIEHVLDGSLSGGKLVGISVDGPFAKQAWTLDEEADGMFVMMSLAGLSDHAAFIVKDGPAAAAISRLASQVGIERRLAA